MQGDCGIVAGPSGSNAIGFLRSPTCNQDENHFNWIISFLLNSDETFRHRFLESAVGVPEDQGIDNFTAIYQESSASSRPDLKVRFASDGRRFLLFIETKVESPVSLEQLARHVEGLQKEQWIIEDSRTPAMTEVILLAPRSAIPNDVPRAVRCMAWEDIHDMLIASNSDQSRSLVAAELAEVLEMRGLADFEGFDIDAWRRYLEMRSENTGLIKLVEDQAGSYVTSVRNMVNKAVLEGKAPFDHFASAAATRGTASEFTIYPKTAWKAQSHWGHVKVLINDGLIEASSGTETTKHCNAYLKAVGDKETKLAGDGWQLWYAGGGLEGFADISSWKHLVQQKIIAVSLVRLRELGKDREVLSEPAVLDQTFADLSHACRFLVDLLG